MYCSLSFPPSPFALPPRLRDQCDKVFAPPESPPRCHEQSFAQQETTAGLRHSSGPRPMGRLPKRARTTPTWPYTGGWCGIAWNDQALLSGDSERQNTKSVSYNESASKPDFVLLQETHSTDGGVLTWSGLSEYVFLYVHGTPASAGVRILVRYSFLDNLDKPLSHRVESNFPG